MIGGGTFMGIKKKQPGGPKKNFSKNLTFGHENLWGGVRRNTGKAKKEKKKNKKNQNKQLGGLG